MPYRRPMFPAGAPDPFYVRTPSWFRPKRLAETGVLVGEVYREVQYRLKTTEHPMSTSEWLALFHNELIEALNARG